MAIKTVILDKQNMIVGGPYAGGYAAEFPEGIINDGLRERPYQTTAIPLYNPDTQRVVDLGYLYTKKTDSYVQKWEVLALSPYELAVRDWPHLEYAMRIVAPIALGEKYPGIKIHFELTGLPVEVKNGLVYMYCNIILASHETIINENSDRIFVEQIHEILQGFTNFTNN